MRRFGASTVLALAVVTLGSVWACSSDDKSNPPSASGGDGSDPSGGATDGTAGSKATSGSSNGGSSAHAGSANHGGASDGGVANDGGAANQMNDAGAGTVGGAGLLPDGGAPGEEPTPGPPDLITSNGGPWPDSATGACSNPAKAIVCPQKDQAFFGQDGTYRINVPTYTTTVTTMKDSVTSLVWQLNPDKVAKSQAEAVTYCDDLTLGGQSDWRLPTRLEYVSVLDEGFGSGFAMPPSVPVDSTGTFWTASATGTTAGVFFAIDDAAGVWNVATGTSAALARCVRGTTPSGTLTVGTDVVTDSMTKLVWQSTELESLARNWQEALDYCETLSHAGKEDWRLPSIKELATLVDEAATVAPVIAADFGASPAPAYWSSTPARSFGGERFAIALETAFGISPSYKMTESAAAARCVRSAD